MPFVRTSKRRNVRLESSLEKCLSKYESRSSSRTSALKTFWNRQSALFLIESTSLLTWFWSPAQPSAMRYYLGCTLVLKKSPPPAKAAPCRAPTRAISVTLSYGQAAVNLRSPPPTTKSN
ncbi:hypothetical protein EVAR_28003_1 [Eumeta japonica]|uniref:Uncharacterized protein n=1 Tax=Eumeta variegata TaxID=151549 RepID=A0A4C1WEP4_EUMVA|nr:hypothetical protein EVAR_28003_1 [Eumeta japonica]